MSVGRVHLRQGHVSANAQVTELVDLLKQDWARQEVGVVLESHLVFDRNAGGEFKESS